MNIRVTSEAAKRLKTSDLMKLGDFKKIFEMFRIKGDCQFDKLIVKF